MKIFISYSSKYREEIRELEKDLESMGHDVWIDQELEGGHKWWDEILYQIRQCDLLLFAMSPESMLSEACHLEYTYAHALGKVVLPVKIEPVDDQGLPEILGQIQYVNFTDTNNREMRRKLNSALADQANRIVAESAPSPLPDVTPPPMPYVAVDTIRTILQSVTIEPSVQQQIYNELVKNRLPRESTAPVARELLLQLTEHLSIKEEYRTKGWNILCKSLDGLIFIVEKGEFLSPPLQSKVVDSLKQYLTAPESDIKEKADNLLRDMAHRPAIQGEARGQVITLLCHTAEGLRYVVKDVGVPEPSVSFIIEVFRLYLDDEQTVAFARDLLKTAATQLAFQSNETVLTMLSETVDGLTFVVDEFGITDLSQPVVVDALRQHTQNADTEEQARKLLQSVAADPALQGNVQVIEMLCETVGGLAFVINDLDITETSAQIVINALRRQTKNADTKEQAHILLQSAAIQPILQDSETLLKMLCETVDGLAFVVDEFGITGLSQSYILEALHRHTQNADTRVQARKLLQTMANNSAITGKVRVKLIESLCQSMDGLQFIVQSKQLLLEPLQLKMIASLDEYVKGNEAKTKNKALDLLRTMRFMPALSAEATLQIAKILLDSFEIIDHQLAQPSLPTDEQLDIAAVLLNWPENEYAEASKRLKQLLERKDLDAAVKTKYEEIYQSKERVRLESDPEYVRKKAYEYNDRELWRQWAQMQGVLPFSVFFHLHIALMLGVTSGSVITLLGPIVFGSWELKFPTTAIDLMQSPGWLPLLIAAVIHAVVLYRVWWVELHLAVSVLRMVLIYVLSVVFTVAWTEGLVHLVGMGLEVTLQKPLSLAHVIGLVIGVITGLSMVEISVLPSTKGDFKGLVGILRNGFRWGVSIGGILAFLIALVLILVYGFTGGVIFFVYALLIITFSTTAIVTFFGSNLLATPRPGVTPGNSKEESNNSSKSIEETQKEIDKD